MQTSNLAAKREQVTLKAKKTLREESQKRWILLRAFNLELIVN